MKCIVILGYFVKVEGRGVCLIEEGVFGFLLGLGLGVFGY